MMVTEAQILQTTNQDRSHSHEQYTICVTHKTTKNVQKSGKSQKMANFSNIFDNIYQTETLDCLKLGD